MKFEYILHLLILLPLHMYWNHAYRLLSSITLGCYVVCLILFLPLNNHTESLLEHNKSQRKFTYCASIYMSVLQAPF
jgi:hypothetical protein